ncbi:unnamed protein product [Parnassius mnemosyne]|uniref:Gag-pol polyprotein n=1 Tax=Parnassius mnemosyne TaxID=213953 RepID=A0AAV1LSU8_9NEOP
MKLSRIESLFSEFEELQNQIEEKIAASDLNTELISRELIEQDFNNCISIGRSLVQRGLQPNQPSPHCSNNDSHFTSVNESVSFKLPVIQIPKFDGTYYKWLEFKETFGSLINDNDKIQNIHKFHYLISYLEGEAARVICNLEVSHQNYNEAWKLLCERFDNKRQLISNHLNSLFNFTCERESDKSLRFIIDHVTKNLRALSTLGLPTEKWDVLIIHIVSARLDSTTSLKWEEHRNTLPEIPSLKDLFIFLKCRADVLESVHRNKTKQVTTSKGQTKSLIVTSKGSSLNNSPSCKPSKRTFECMVCKGDYRIFECPDFKSKTPEERVTTATRAINRLCILPIYDASTA